MAGYPMVILLFVFKNRCSGVTLRCGRFLGIVLLCFSAGRLTMLAVSVLPVVRQDALDPS